MPKKTREMKILIPTTKIQEAVKCENTKQAYNIFREILNYESYELKNQEHFWIMGIDSAGYVVCVYIAAIGSENTMIIDPVDMFSTAIAHKSKKVYLAHNHPCIDEDIHMSPEDFELTLKLYYACLPFGIEILDHIILADDTYYSFIENAYMAIIKASPMYKTYKELKPKLEEEKKIYGEFKMLEGVKEGIDIGIDKGKQEEKIEMAKKMLLKNKSIEEIIEFTGLSREAIEEIELDI